MTNLTRSIRAIIAGLLIALPEISAQVTMTVSAPVPGSVGNATVIAGPLALPLSINSSSSGGSASLTAADNFSGQVAPTAFQFTGHASAYASASPVGFPPTGGYAASSKRINATFRLTFSTPTPFTGALRLQSSQYYTWYSFGLGTTIESASGSATTRIDIGADGTIEHEFVAGVGVNVGAIELPVAFQSTLVVDVVVQLTQSASASSSPWASASASGSADMTLTGELNDDYFVVQEHATTGATSYLGFDHGFSGNLDLELKSQPSSATTMSGLFAIGLQPVVIPLLPTVTQLVTLDAIAMGGHANATLPPLPSGTTLYVQGFGVDAIGDLTSTRSLRVLWL